MGCHNGGGDQSCGGSISGNRRAERRTLRFDQPHIAGGFGMLGAVRFTPDQLDEELSWLDAETHGRPDTAALMDDMESTPAMVENCPSSTFATALAMVSGVAPVFFP